MAQKTITDLRNLDALASSLLFAADGDTETFNITLDALFDYIDDRKGDIATGVIEMYMGETIPSTHTELDGKSFDVLVYPKMGALFPSGVLPDTRGMMLKHAPDGRSVLSFESGEIKSHTHGAVFYGDPVADHVHSTFSTQYAVSGGSGNIVLVAQGSGNITGYGGGHVPSGTVSVNSSGGAKNLVDNISVKFIIKKA